MATIGVNLLYKQPFFHFGFNKSSAMHSHISVIACMLSLLRKAYYSSNYIS